MKAVIQRPRPEVLAPLIRMPTDFSFPSAHRTQITAFYLCLVFLVGKDRSIGFGVLCLVSVALIGCVAFSRVYLRVHFASYVVGGFLLPVIWVSGIAFLLPRM